MTQKDTPRSKRYTVPEAAKVLGIGTDAVRKRIARDTIPHEKDAKGRVYVYLDTGHDEGHDVREAAPELVEAPREASEDAETVEEEPERAEEPRPATGGAQEGTEYPQQRGGWLAPVNK